MRIEEAFMKNVWAVTLEVDLWAVTGCWNHLLLLPTLHDIFPLITSVGIWWWTLGLSTPRPPSTHPSHFEHTSTNSHLPHTHCMHAMLNQTLTSDRRRVELDVETAGFAAEPVERHFCRTKFRLPRVAFVSLFEPRGETGSKFIKTDQRESQDEASLSSLFSSSLSLLLSPFTFFLYPSSCFSSVILSLLLANMKLCSSPGKHSFDQKSWLRVH